MFYSSLSWDIERQRKRQRQRETETERDRERARQRKRHRERQRDRERERQRQRHREREKERERQRERQRETHRSHNFGCVVPNSHRAARQVPAFPKSNLQQLPLRFFLQHLPSTSYIFPPSSSLPSSSSLLPHSCMVPDDLLTTFIFLGGEKNDKWETRRSSSPSRLWLLFPFFPFFFAPTSSPWRTSFFGGFLGEKKSQGLSPPQSGQPHRGRSTLQ